MKRILPIAALCLGLLAAGAFAAQNDVPGSAAAQLQQHKPAAKKSLKKSSKSTPKGAKAHRSARRGQQTNR